MTATQLLTKAIQYELCGRKLESLKLYEDGISELLKTCKAEADKEKKKHYQKKLTEYMDQAEKLKQAILNWGSKGEIRDKIHIAENAKNYSYHRIFGKYLTEDVEEILIEEPYMKDHYHLCNLVMFCELAVTNCKNLKCIRITTNKDTNKESEQDKGLQSIANSLLLHNVCLSINYTSSLHDRQILLSNGYIIKIGRGLNYFKPLAGKLSLGQFNYNFRECRETNVDIFYCPESYKM
ncbi:CLUMA_CG019543, isoform A [Clunio marinus]|uniref:CLUMA_CG019543, isoform A n=1 Tax=Clunio marinus TaxID=568069 RepID=A0A1J1J4T0_9DIPT|nr:CLUMA_CG019543, isoform A [Clunio marinus]